MKCKKKFKTIRVTKRTKPLGLKIVSKLKKKV